MGKDQRKQQTGTGRQSRSQSNSSSGSGSYDSPVKKSVVSKVERAQGPPAKDRNRINTRRPVERTAVSQDRSRQRAGFTGPRGSTSSGTRPLSNPRHDVTRSSSLDRRPRGSLSPRRQPDDVRLNPREGRQNRSLSKERLIARDSREERSRYSHSPVRNMGTMDNNMPFDQFQGIRSPYGGPGRYRRDDSFRDRGGNRFKRGRGLMDDRSRSFDRQNDSRGFNYFSGGFDRRMPNRGASPEDFIGKDRNEGPSITSDSRQRAFTAGQKSPVPLLSIQIEKRSNKSRRSVSVERRKNSPKISPDFKRKDRSDRPNVNLDRNRSLSAGQKSPSATKANKNGNKINKSNRSVSKERRTDSPDSSPEKLISSKKNYKQKRKEDDVADSDQNLDRRSNISKVSKSSKKSDDKDDSVERSFERSKLSLGASANADVLNFKDDIPITSPSSGMLQSKRQLDNSDLALESPRKKVKTKEVEERLESDKEKSKDTKKKDTKTKKSFDSSSVSIEKSSSISPKKAVSNKKTKALISRSPSPSERKSAKLNRPLDPDRSKSKDISFGRHDMTRFESEPESGEITDSDDETEKTNKQALKSLINKPLEEGFEDERYLNARKKAMLINKRDEDGKMSAEDKDSSNKRKAEDIKEPEPKASEPAEEPVAKKPKVQDTEVATFTGRTGGAYIPPARLRAMQAKITDKSSVEFQRISWEALKKSINGLVNKVNVSNIENIVRDLFQENIVRGRGLMARSIIQAQAASPTFTHVYAALVAVINTKFPQNGELILRRLIIQFRRGFKRNDKAVCLTSTQFIAHLLNQQVAHEVLVLEILTLLLETPTDDSIEVAIGFLKECGQTLTKVSPRAINEIFARLRNILHEGQIDTRVQYMVEVMFAVRKDQFKDHPAIIEELDLVEEEDQFTHLLSLEEAANGEEILNVFKPDPEYLENEEKYKILKKEILGEGSSDEEDVSGSGSGDEGDSGESENEEDEKAKQTIIDQTETNMVTLRRTIYLTIQSSLDFEECAHKLMKMELKPGQEVELCSMILDCCAQMRTFEKFFGLLAGRFCMIDRKYVTPFQVMFKEQYDTIHRLETNKLRNVAKFFAHLLFTDAISWEVLQCIKLNEDDTTSASRIFIKILFQELSEYLGLQKLNERLKDPTLHEYFTGIMPCDNPRDTRFAINFFTTIGLGGLTDDLRDHLKEVSKQLMLQKQEEQAAAAKDVPENSDDDSSDSSSENSDTASSDSESSSDSRSSEGRKRKPADVDLSEVSRKGKPDKDLKSKVSHKKKDNETVSNKDKSKDKSAQRKRNIKNGSFDKNDTQTLKKKDDKKKIQKGQTEVDARLEREEHFKKLATLANYGDIDRITPEYEKGVGKAERREKRKEKKNKDKKEKKTDKKRENDNFGIDVVRSDFSEREGRGHIRDRSRDQLDSSQNLERSFDGGFEGRDGRMSVQDDVLRGRDNREGRESEKKGRKGKGQGKKVRGSVQDDDRAIRVERKFEQMDLYEYKFEREREKNVEILRDREEFRDYYKGRERAAMSSREPSYRDRDLSPRGEIVPFRERDLSPRGLPYRERDPYMGDTRGGGANLYGMRPEVPYREHGFERILNKNRRESNRGGAARGNFIRRDDRRRR